MADLASGVRQRVSARGTCRFPVFGPDDRSVVTLCGEFIVTVHWDSGATEELARGPLGIERLLGVDQTAPLKDVRLVVITTEGLRTFSVGSQELTAIAPVAEDDREFLEALNPSEVQYGLVLLFVTPSPPPATGKAGTEIFVQMDGNEPKQLTQCGPDVCGQPALSHDQKHVVFVRTKE